MHIIRVGLIMVTILAFTVGASGVVAAEEHGITFGGPACDGLATASDHADDRAVGLERAKSNNDCHDFGDRPEFGDE